MFDKDDFVCFMQVKDDDSYPVFLADPPLFGPDGKDSDFFIDDVRERIFIARTAANRDAAIEAVRNRILERGSAAKPPKILMSMYEHSDHYPPRPWRCPHCTHFPYDDTGVGLAALETHLLYAHRDIPRADAVRAFRKGGYRGFQMQTAKATEPA